MKVRKLNQSILKIQNIIEIDYFIKNIHTRINPRVRTSILLLWLVIYDHLKPSSLLPSIRTSRKELDLWVESEVLVLFRNWEIHCYQMYSMGSERTKDHQERNIFTGKWEKEAKYAEKISLHIKKLCNNIIYFYPNHWNKL